MQTTKSNFLIDIIILSDCNLLLEKNNSFKQMSLPKDIVCTFFLCLCNSVNGNDDSASQIHMFATDNDKCLPIPNTILATIYSKYFFVEELQFNGKK